jgi:hypothetical protein
MSRSNPTVNEPNPATKWFEWNGETGTVRYYDKDLKRNLDVPLPFPFLLLDELASVRGWHEASKSGIFSNEVRDTSTDALIVKAFKGGTLAEGLYKSIKDRVNTQGGQYVANCYIAYKNGGPTLSTASLRFKGAALGGWMEFRKANRRALYERAVKITGYTEGKKGKVTFRVPTFALVDVSPETQDQALLLDQTLQAWLESYLQRRTRDQAEEPAHIAEDPGPDHDAPMLTDDEIPF